MDKDFIINTTSSILIEKYPFLTTFFEDNNIFLLKNQSLKDYFNKKNFGSEEDRKKEIKKFVETVIVFINRMMDFLGESENRINKLTIFSGKDKNGNCEKFEKLEVNSGDIISIVGPTGSGKSRFLADIEWLAQRDTPTQRKIILNNIVPDSRWRFSPSEKIVAQLSQNMNFTMDLTIKEFLELHTQSRLIANYKTLLKNILFQANKLSGEKFDDDSPITSLSGGQSRALMIADTALLCKSPIILIDEIENAGINRTEALNLLLDQNKIVFIATHDPILALMCKKRIVIKNGEIVHIINRTEKERQLLLELEEYDKKIQSYRNKLRNGQILND
jgi:ABC-type lipoprotein export system ATPase subunit